MSYQSRFSFCGTPVIPKQKADENIITAKLGGAIL